ncbi:DUF1700 domain-containing protein [Clostridium sp. C105KSO13]|uniref:DUF1700 domain-containing protein n=1 Tax=Clostridium sp. C105KSO13 TaxID=1776045 RepID=UPI0007406CAB|nr:hypothetical protein [Clostridium sp. C105KSO13]CUX45534.1 hypothetical protein BN3456_02518 [Clostridium sp. C105KSO13]
MNREEFMYRLEQLLMAIPVDERQAALQYYQDYFEDAGVENEAQVISELRSPEQVAATIKADLKDGSKEHGEFTENGYSYDQSGGKGELSIKTPPRTSRALKIVLIILIALTVIPFAWPLLIGCVGIVIGLVCAAFGLFAGLVLGSVLLMAAGVVLFIAGLTKLLTALPVALLTSGSGLVVFVLGLIATVAAVKLCVVVYPALIRGIVSICRWPFQRKKVS